MSRSHPFREIYSSGSGKCVVYACRRRCHDDPIELYNRALTKITKIRNTKMGISIVCYIEGQNYRSVFEHYDIWLASNAREKLIEYFEKNHSKKSLDQLKYGRLRFLLIELFGPSLMSKQKKRVEIKKRTERCETVIMKKKHLTRA